MDLIIMNGKIITMNPKHPKAEAVAIKDGKFEKVGSNEEVLKLKTELTEMVDIKGKVLVPGFNDSHVHFLDFGYSLSKADLNGSKSIDEMIQRTKAFFQDKVIRENDWLKGRGWNQDIFREKRFPNRYDLDKISTERPIYLTRVCGHVAVVNSKALEIMGVTKDSEQVEGGYFELDENGEPTGIFCENALELIYDNIPALKTEDLKKMLICATEAYAAEGITSVQTDDLMTLPGMDYEDIIRIYKELASEGKLKTRVYQQCRFSTIDEYRGFLSKGYRTGVGDDYFKIGPLKIVGDGSLGGRTAFMTEPYADDPTTIGIPCLTQEEMDEWVHTAHKENMTIAVHSIGDAAMYRVLESIEKVQKAMPKEDMRHSIIHCQITDLEIIRKFSRLGVIAHVQPVFLNYDLHIVEDRIGKERAKYTYNFKRMLDEGVHVAGGSDFPYCEFYQGVYNLYTVINRRDINGYPEGGWLPDQKLSVDEALAIFTIGGAYASYEENIKGTIEEGRLADCFVMSHNIYDINPLEIKDISIEMTFVGGKLVYKNEKELL
ncbi:MAG: amidohydrolase [Clostridia bacterium]|nr:amidohydrolase [Clostridia bacterium]